MELPLYTYAIGSALLWACSAPIINVGLRRLPSKHMTGAVLSGLLASQLSGAITLFLLLGLFTQFGNVRISIYTIAAGILTFPVATGLYYLSGVAFGHRMEFASQFAKVKPLFTIGLATFILGEILTVESKIALLAITLGIAALTLASLRQTFSFTALGLGLLTALAWAIGEMFIKLGIGDDTSLGHTFIALVSGLIISLFTLGPITIRTSLKCGVQLSWLGPFLIHGILSFGAAYALFFESIRVIGLGKTVLINAFWPALAVILSCGIERIRGAPCAVPPMMWIAVALLLIGAVIQAIQI